MAAAGRRIAGSAAIAVFAVLFACASPALAGDPVPEGVKATADSPAVPGVTPWGALVMALLMVTSSSFALYGGKLPWRSRTAAAPRTESARPLEASSTATAEVSGKSAPARSPAVLRDRGDRRSPAGAARHGQLRRQSAMARRLHADSSRSKKRRMAAGCRGPLRKT